ncbi:MAG: DsbC family protein [Pseudomonadota bacterium]
MERLKTWIVKQPKDALIAMGIGTIIVLLMLVTRSFAAAPPNNDIYQSVADRFGESRINAVDCDGFGPLCQVIAGKTVLYIDRDVRHAFIGRLYDLEAGKDLTAETLALLSPDHGLGPEPVAVTRSVVRFEDLPLEAAIVRNEGGTRKIAVFSDLHCGYCRRLSEALSDAPDIEAHEFLIGWAGSEEASRAIGCADDPAGAIETYYRTRSIHTEACDRDIVTPARAAAKALGVRGTPTFVRSDGAMLSGFQDIETLRTWIDQAKETEE